MSSFHFSAKFDGLLGSLLGTPVVGDLVSLLPVGDNRWEVAVELGVGERSVCQNASIGDIGENA